MKDVVEIIEEMEDNLYQEEQYECGLSSETLEVAFGLVSFTARNDVLSSDDARYW